ncbi:MAG: hypothetical protein KBS75_03095 [Bacteroidales bacterium]|nr:hypothetical protein [Candidatus Equimonas faecalis]
MDYFKEEDFYKEAGSPTEYLLYCSYIFFQQSETEWGRDYDQFALVGNAEYPYIRLTRKRGQSHYPSGGSSKIAVDGSFARKSEKERDAECPKIAWGLAAEFLGKLRFDARQDDYVLAVSCEKMFSDYYGRYLTAYLDCHSSLKYENISKEQKELDFIESHITHMAECWEKSAPLKNYTILYEYAKNKVAAYEQFVLNKRNNILKTINPMKNSYSTEVREIFKKKYVKVFFLDDSIAEAAQEAISALICVKNANITISESNAHPGKTLTVQPKPMVLAEDCEKEVCICMDHFLANEVIGEMQPHNEAYFAGIENRIIERLDKAQATIDVCVAWFTNERLRDKLLEKQAQGIAVRVIIYKDGVNHNHGVDLSEIKHKEYRGERGGIMHEKYCVIDNVTTINGSYNWTLNAENKNDEDAVFHITDVDLASSYTRQFNAMWNRDENA